jgi:oligosaccharide repeat unit polymerase
MNRRNRKYNPFNFITINIVLFIYFYIIPFMFSINLNNYNAFLFATCGLFFLYAGTTMVPRVQLKDITVDFTRSFNLKFLLLCLILPDIVQITRAILFGIEIVDYADNFSIKDNISLYSMIPGMMIRSFKLYMYALLMGENKVIFIFVLALELFIAFMAQTRMVLIQTVVIFATYAFYMGFYKPKVWHFVVFVLSSPLIFTILLIKRGVVGVLTLSQFFIEIVKKLSMKNIGSLLLIAVESFDSYEIFSMVINNRFVRPGNGIIRIFFMPIPRTIWDSKPEAMGREIARFFNPYNYRSGGGNFATLFGDLYINGSLIGVIVLSVAIGFIGKMLQNLAEFDYKKNSVAKSVMAITYGFFISEYLNYFRGYFSDSYWKLICFIIIFAISHYFTIRRFWNSSEKLHSIEG